MLLPAAKLSWLSGSHDAIRSDAMQDTHALPAEIDTLCSGDGLGSSVVYTQLPGFATTPFLAFPV